MNIHIQLDPYNRGDIFWVANDQTGAGAIVHGTDHYDLASIDEDGKKQLRELLERASDGNWSAHAIPAEEFARRISAAFVGLLPSFERIFKASPSFYIPAPLREALNIEQSVMIVSDWLDQYPPSAS